MTVNKFWFFIPFNCSVSTLHVKNYNLFLIGSLFKITLYRVLHLIDMLSDSEERVEIMLQTEFIIFSVHLMKSEKLIIKMNYCKPTFVCVREIFMRLARALSPWIFLAANQSFVYSFDNNTGLDKTWSRTLVLVN